MLFSVVIFSSTFIASFTSTPYVSLSPQKNEDERMYYLGSVLVVHILLSCSLLIFNLLYVLAKSIFDIHVLSYSLIEVFTISLCGIFLRDFVRQLFLAEMNLWKNLWYGACVHLPIIIVLLVTDFIDAISLVSVYLIIGLFSIIPPLVILFFIKEKIRFSRAKLFKHIKENWYVGKWLLASILVFTISGPLYGWILAYFHGKAMVGLYGACLLPVSILSPMGQAMFAYITPKISHISKKGVTSIRKLVCKAVFIMLVPILLFILALYFTSNELMMVLLVGKYTVPPVLIVLFAIQISLIVISVPINSGLVVLQKTKVSFNGELLAVLVTIVIGIPLIYYFDVWGVAVGLILSRLVNRGYQTMKFMLFTGKTV